MNQKGFVNIILVLVIVTLVGVVGYFTFVNRVKTYTDKGFGFSFEYLSKYSVSSEGRTEYAEEVLTLTSNPRKLLIIDACRGEYTIQVKKSDISFNQLERDAQSKYNYISDLSIDFKTIDGHKAFRVSGINKVGADFTGKHTKDYLEDFILFDNGNTYIELYPCSNEYYNRDEISQMFSSFKFGK
ncbi:MAG: hypothetical protein NTY31_01380 [Candidatus Falkowbacteria bacterium]|nr:hypothetical protein [Candidatus Falkowbacteria bacterium]